jgi:acyl-coenzyme A thioesterase PaaI-like protein
MRRRRGAEEKAPAGGLGANLPPAPILELAEEVRELTETMVRIAALPEDAAREAEALAAQIARTRERLAAHALHDATPRMGPEPATQRPYYTAGVLMGPHHPLRPDLEIAHDAGVTHGTVRFGVSFEGPPGCVHGGYVAHFFDQILGEHNLLAKVPAMTGTLSVRYRRGTPILRDLRFEVTHERVGERKVVTRGFLADGEEVFSEAEGTFVVPKSAAWGDGAGK